MYRLYELNSMSLLDASEDEYDLINTMSLYLQAYRNIRFRIKHYDSELNEEVTIKDILNVGQYYDYCKEYENIKLKEMSCLDLKRQILKKKSV